MRRSPLLSLLLLALASLVACGDSSGPSVVDETAATPGDDATGGGPWADALAGDATDAAPADATAPEDAGPSDDPDVCQPACLAKECGPDGCGGTCGTCGDSSLCGPGGVCQSFLCTQDQLDCQGDILVRCDEPLLGPTVVQTCALGCAAGACITTCEPGASLGCVGGVANRCDALGLDSFSAQCLAGCDDAGLDCEPLGAEERLLATGEGQGDEVVRFTIEASEDGTMLLVWNRLLSSGIRVLMLDADGNAITGPGALVGSAGIEPTQLAVSGSPDGGSFAALAIYPHPTGSGAATALWRITRSGKLLESTQLADAEPLTFPSLVALTGRLSLFHLYTAGAGTADETLARTSWLVGDPSPLVEVVDSAATTRFDVIATRVGPGTAHVFASLDGGMRVSVSTTANANAGTETLDPGDYAFADASGRDTTSAVAVLRFDEPERFEYRFHGVGAEGAPWVDLGKAESWDWVQLVRTDAGVTVARQAIDGTLELASGTAAGVPGAWSQVWLPKLGASRKDFDLVMPGGVTAPRLLTRGTDSSSENMALRISVAAP